VLGSAGARRVLDLAIGMGDLSNVAELARATVPTQAPARTPEHATTVMAR
jgi:hypothetical protein